MKASTLLLVMGGLLILGGLLALANPFAASLAVTTLVGIIFLGSGIIQTWALFRDGTVHGRWWNIAVALLAIVSGVWLLANPLEGMVSLTIVVGATFFAMGLVRLLLSGALRGTPFFWMLLLSGLGSVAIGLIVLLGFAAAATSFLGILLGVQLLAEGIGLVALGLFGRGSGT